MGISKTELATSSTAAVSSAATATTTAVATEATARASADTAEIAARNTAITAAILGTVQTATPTDGQTVSVTAGSIKHTVYIDPAGTLPTLTVALPTTSLIDGQTATLVPSQIVTILTLTSGGTIVGALTAFALGVPVTYKYATTGTKWRRVG